MSDASAKAPCDPASYVQMWAEILAQVLGEIAGSPPPTAVLTEPPAELTPPADSDLWILVSCSGSVRGEMSLRFPVAATARLAQLFMSEPAPAAEPKPEQREAVLELMRQVGGLAATAIKSTWGEAQLHLEFSPSAPSWTASLSSWIRVGENPAALLEIHLSAALAAALRTEKPEPDPLAANASAPSPAAAPPSPPQAHNDRVNLDLLLDVELAVTLRFGSRTMPLRDVLDLNPGAVVDLDRRVQEPIDMLLDGRVVARGEVVVVDGNYGLRVTEVAPANP